jgi:hypothetical protein
MMPAVLHQRISDYSRCPECVREARRGFACGYFNVDDKLYGVCARHGTRWLVTGRALLHPEIPDLTGFDHLVAAFAYVEPAASTPEAPAGRRKQAQGTRLRRRRVVTAKRVLVGAASARGDDAAGLGFPQSGPMIDRMRAEARRLGFDPNRAGAE